MERGSVLTETLLRISNYSQVSLKRCKKPTKIFTAQINPMSVQKAVLWRWYYKIERLERLGIYSTKDFNLFFPPHIVQMISDFQPTLQHMQLTETTITLINPWLHPSPCGAEHLHLSIKDIYWGHLIHAKAPSAQGS